MSWRPGLAAVGTDQAEFIDLLAERCGGVWVYLRYVLDELRLGTRRPDQISDLPSKLPGYYADQIRRWQQDPGWHTGLLPLAGHPWCGRGSIANSVVGPDGRQR